MSFLLPPGEQIIEAPHRLGSCEEIHQGKEKKNMRVMFFSGILTVQKGQKCCNDSRARGSWVEFKEPHNQSAEAGGNWDQTATKTQKSSWSCDWMNKLIKWGRRKGQSHCFSFAKDYVFVSSNCIETAKKLAWHHVLIPPIWRSTSVWNIRWN